jgi:crotonobetainyl-CoA:carnitine CoA-transferase CaiB-like acyl-CoA transferase
MDVMLGGTARGPLAGVRVIDLSTVVSGPFCTQVLGDLGADVWKIENPRGDSTRMMGPPFKGGLTPIFAHFNRNKRSVVVDLKQPDGLAVVRRLAARADVLVENFRPGVMERLGLDYAGLAADNPGLVYVSVNGFGSDGPYRDLPAYDNVIQGLVGFAAVQGGGGTPSLVRCIAADKTTGMTAVYSTLAALFARERGDGRGQHVEVPMLDAYAAFMLPDVLGPATFDPPPEGGSFDMSRVHRAWETADGHVVMMIIEDHQFQGLCRALEREDLMADPRFASLMDRVANLDVVLALAEQELRKWPTAELVERARRFGAPLAPVNDVAAFLADPQVVASGAVIAMEDSEAGPMRFLGSPARFRDTPTSFRRMPPRLGEHTDEVLGEAGFGAEEIGTLRAACAVF